MAVLLQEQNHAGLMQGVDDGGTTAPDIQGGNQVWHRPPHVGWPEADRGRLAWSRKMTRVREGGADLIGRGPGGRGRFRQWVLCPNIIMTYGGCGIPKVARGSYAYGLDAKGSVDLNADTVHGCRRSNLEGAPPLGTVAGLGTELMQ